MKKQLLKTSLSLLKSFKTGLFVCLLFVLLPGFSYAIQSVSFGVTFGTAQDDGGPCVGKGVCKESFDMDSVTLIYKSNPEAVTVTFQISPADSNVLMMSFLLSELRTKQPDKVPTFLQGTYSFNAPDSLISSTLSQLTFPEGAAITSGSPSKSIVNGDIVTVYIVLVTNPGN